jgi:hypothetical protein
VTTTHFDRFIRPLLASRYFTISAVIHLLIVILFGGKVLFNKYVEPPDFQSAGDGGADTGPIAPPPPDTLPPPPPLVAPPPIPAAAANAIVSINAAPSNFAIPLPAIAPPTITKSMGKAGPQTFKAGPAVALPASMRMRDPTRHSEAAASYGEKSGAEEAVLKALRWLQAKQNADGTWSTQGFKGGMTGLSLLCYLGHGETPANSHEFGAVVNAAITALEAESARNEGRLTFVNGFQGNASAYEHAICTYALCEAYTMTKDDKLAPIVTKAVDYILKGQRENGGWAYSYDVIPGPLSDKDHPTGIEKSDTSVSGWQIQALKAAHLTGLPGMSGVPAALDKAMKNMDRVFNPKNGSFGYRMPGDHDYTLTGVGALSKLFWMGRADRNIREAIKNIQSKEVKWDDPSANIYSWYYNTQASFQAQGGAWDWWKSRFQDQLTSHQNSDGSWPPIGPPPPPPKPNEKPAGSLNGFLNGPNDVDHIYRTTLCCLMLEVFYRYLPTSQSGGGGGVEGL